MLLGSLGRLASAPMPLRSSGFWVLARLQRGECCGGDVVSAFTGDYPYMIENLSRSPWKMRDAATETASHGDVAARLAHAASSALRRVSEPIASAAGEVSSASNHIRALPLSTMLTGERHMHPIEPNLCPEGLHLQGTNRITAPAFPHPTSDRSCPGYCRCTDFR